MLRVEHFERFAQILGVSANKEEIIERCLDYFEEQNYLFNRDRFIKKMKEWEEKSSSLSKEEIFERAECPNLVVIKPYWKYDEYYEVEVV